MSIFTCRDPHCRALKRPVLPLGSEMASHIYHYHGGNKIVEIPEQLNLDPDGSVGLAIIDRMLKFCDDFDKVLDKKPPYKPRFIEPYHKLREQLVIDVQEISKAAKGRVCGNSSESSGAAISSG